MTCRQVMVRLALVILTASYLFINFSNKVLADEATTKSDVKTAANLVPEPAPKLNRDELEALSKTPSQAPDLDLPESDSSADVSPKSKPDQIKRPQRSMLIPTNWTQSARLIPTEIDANFDVVQASGEEPVPEAVAQHTSPQATRAKGKALSTRGTNRSRRAVYTQPQNPRPVAQPQNHSRDPALIGFFVPLMSVNAPFGVSKSAQVAAAPAKPRLGTSRPAKPTVAEMLSVQVPARPATQTPVQKLNSSVQTDKVPSTEAILPRRGSTSDPD